MILVSTKCSRPNLAYNVLPFHAGTVDYKQEVDMRDLVEMKLMCTKPGTSGCEDDFAVRCSDLMRQNAKVYPEFKVKTKGTIENGASKQHTSSDTNIKI